LVPKDVPVHTDPRAPEKQITKVLVDRAGVRGPKLTS